MCTTQSHLELCIKKGAVASSLLDIVSKGALLSRPLLHSSQTLYYVNISFNYLYIKE